MVQRSIDTQFNVDWEKAIAWAQTRGIDSQSWLPIYQMDANRLQNGEPQMSTAERNRAMLAAKNPNNVTPVPSDKPNPASILGNARNDLRSIFTGLAPNHLIPNIFHTVESAVLHPSTWERPLADIAKGDIRTGLEEAGSPNSILSWLPGVYDLSELAKGGVDQVLSHPIVSLLNVAPFAPAGRILSMAADSARMGAWATKLGFSSPEELERASVPHMAASWVLSKNVAKVNPDGTISPNFPGIGNLTAGTLVDADKKPLTISGAFKFWGERHSGLSRSVAYLASALFDSKTYATDSHMYSIGPFADAAKKLSPQDRQQLNSLLSDTMLRKQGATPEQIMRKMDVSQPVRDAYNLGLDALALDESRAAVGGMVAVFGPRYQLPNGQYTRNIDWFGANGLSPELLTSHTAMLKDTQELMRVMQPVNAISQQAAEMDKQLPALSEQLDQARYAALKTPIEGNAPQLSTLHPDIEKDLRHATVSLSRSRDLVFGEDGIVKRVLDAASPFDEASVPKRSMNYADIVELSRVGLRDLRKTGHAQLDAELNPNFGAAMAALQAMHDWGVGRLKLERKFADQMLGPGYKRIDVGYEQTRLEVPKYQRPPISRSLAMHEARAKVGRAEKLTPQEHALLEGFAAKRAKREEHMAYRSEVIKALDRAMSSYRKFESDWWNHPADKYRSVMYDYMISQVLKKATRSDRIAAASDRLRDLDYSQRQIDDYLSDETRLAQFIWADAVNARTNPRGFPLIDDEEFDQIVHGAVEHVNDLKNQGMTVSYLPVLRTTEKWEQDPGIYGAKVAKRIADLSATKRRNMTEIMPERYDVVAQVSASTKEAIERDATIEFVENHLSKHALMKGEAIDWAHRAFGDEYAHLDPAAANIEQLEAHHLERMGLSYFNPAAKLGFTFPRWGSEGFYIPAGLAKAMDKMLDHNVFRLDSVYDKATRGFRFSILALSPRYTAHIVFGGAFLLALRSDPRIVGKFGEAYRMVKEGRMDPELRQRASTAIGTEELAPEVRSLHAGLNAANEAGARDGVKMLVDEIVHNSASPIHWVAALGELNYRFTNFVSNMYRAAAYLDASDRAGKSTITLEDGTKVQMSAERARTEGINHAFKVMGNLKAMTPLERTWFMRIMPFYGWTRHILDYVLTYPVDHPYRAGFLATQAEMDSDGVGKALDKRILFMYFFGSPDAQGNVKGVDLRFLDPLRDVANYASWSGWISALNPVFEAPLAMLDPNLVFGSTSLYPSVTYDQFYGIETTATQGNALLTGAKQFVSQIGALDAALNLGGQYRNLATRNPNQFYKTIAESLNIPFAQVQDVNMKQLAAKGELARYKVAEQAAQNAWTQPGMGGTGLENALSGFASVPNPMNSDYEITPQQLQAIYNAYLAAFPGQNPADVAIGPPTPGPTTPTGY